MVKTSLDFVRLSKIFSLDSMSYNSNFAEKLEKKLREIIKRINTMTVELIGLSSLLTLKVKKSKPSGNEVSEAEKELKRIFQKYIQND